MGDSSSAWGAKAQELVKCLAVCTFWMCFSTLQMRSCTWAMAQQRTLHFPECPGGDSLGDTDKHWDEHWDVLSPRAFTKGACLHQGLLSKLCYQQLTQLSVSEPTGHRNQVQSEFPEPGGPRVSHLPKEISWPATLQLGFLQFFQHFWEVHLI